MHTRTHTQQGNMVSPELCGLDWNKFSKMSRNGWNSLDGSMEESGHGQATKIGRLQRSKGEGRECQVASLSEQRPRAPLWELPQSLMCSLRSPQPASWHVDAHTLYNWAVAITLTYSPEPVSESRGVLYQSTDPQDIAQYLEPDGHTGIHTHVVTTFNYLQCNKTPSKYDI